MKISMWRANLLRRPARKLTVTIALVGAVWAPGAKALTADAVAPAPAPAEVAPSAKYSPPVQEILRMVDSKVDPEVIKTYIKNSPTAYSLTAEEIISLKKTGVSDDVITAMIQRGAEVRARAVQAGQPPPTVAAPQYSPGVTTYPSVPEYGADYSDYGTPYYYPSYPNYYSYSYPYYYPYGYNYWGYGYPWYGYYYYPFYCHYCGRYHCFADGHHSHVNPHGHTGTFAGSHNFGTVQGNQAFHPAGKFAGRSASFSGSRGFDLRALQPRMCMPTCPIRDESRLPGQQPGFPSPSGNASRQPNSLPFQCCQCQFQAAAGGELGQVHVNGRAGWVASSWFPNSVREPLGETPFREWVSPKRRHCSVARPN